MTQRQYFTNDNTRTRKQKLNTTYPYEVLRSDIPDKRLVLKRGERLKLYPHLGVITIVSKKRIEG